MCGIAGVLYRDGKLPDERMLESMAFTLRHRGPDGYGVWKSPGVGLVHTRLSILDLSSNGSQPMFLPDKTLGIVFNGEIYNYIEIRAELEQHGVHFRSQCDTEVILWAYRQWGVECFAKMNGMWALAMWDARDRSLIISRDRFGVKPFYYVNLPGAFAFASEAKAFNALDGFRLSADEKWWHQYLSVGYVDTGDETFFRNVKMFPKASYAVVRGGDFNPVPYWHLTPDLYRQKYDYSRPVEQFRELFCDSVRFRLRSDVPVGSCLSGGLDSSSIVSVAASQLPTGVRMHTFSSIYKDPDYSEEFFIRALVRHAQTIPHYLYPTHQDAMDLAVLGAYSMERPCAGPTLISQLNVMREAHRHVKVLLDGQGSDEYLAGYHPFLLSYLNSLWRRAQDKPTMGQKWQFIRAMFSVGGTGQTRPYARQALRSLLSANPGSRLLRALHAVIPGKTDTGAGTQPALPSLLHPSFAAQMKGLELALPSFETPFPDEIDNALYAQFFYQSIPSILLTEDANSMAFSIEARLPFMDYRLVEFIFGLDFTWKVRGWKTKYIQREAMKPYLPRVVANRRDKKGYPTPYSLWLRGPLKDPVESILFSRALAQRGLVCPNALKTLWGIHQSGQMDVSWLIYKALSTEIWHRVFVDRSAAPPQMNRHFNSHYQKAA